MNNAHCKSMFLFLFLLLSSIPHIYASDNGPTTEESVAPDKLVTTMPPTESQSKTSQPVTEEVQLNVDASAYDFVLPTPSTDDEQALQSSLTQDLTAISADKDVQKLLDKATSDMLEPYNEYLINQIQQLDCILDELATNLSSNNYIPTRNRRGALQKIQALRAPLFYLKTANIVPLKADIIFAIAKQIQDIANYARINLEKGIDQCKQYDMSTFDPKLLNNTEDVELQLRNALAENNKTLEQLNAKTSHIGLHYYNMAWRWMHKTVFDPWKTCHGTQLSMGGLWLTSAAFFTWYYFGGQTIPGLPARFGIWLRNKVGWPAQSRDDFILNDPNSEAAAFLSYDEELEKKSKKTGWWGGSNGISSEDLQAAREKVNRKLQKGQSATLKEALTKPVGWLGRLEHRISQFCNNKFMVGSLVLLPTGNLLLSSVAPSFLDWLDKTTQKVDNFLMGGVYRNKRVDSITMNSGVTFDDVIGNETAKNSLRTLIEYFKNPESWERSHIAPKTGYLLYGPTRGGKSFMIDAFLGELVKEFGPQAGFKLWPISYTLILEKGIDWVLEQAREFAPCIIVIEEIDLLGLQRTENKQLLASFLTAMNSCLQLNSMDKTVIVMGTTNRLENIELALRQPGRFGEHLYFQYPSHAERSIYIERELNKLAVMIEQFDIEHLACLTEGCSYEQISAMIKGTLTAAKIDREPVSQKSLEQSLERLVYGISLEPCKIDAKQKRMIATHLAGEIVATVLLDPNLQIAKATIKNVRAKIDEQLVYFQYFENSKQNPLEYGKVFYCHNHDVLPLNSKDEQITQCKIYRAGHTAEALIIGSSSNYHSSDKQHAYEFALATVGEGLDISKLPPSAQNQFFDQAYKMVSDCETEIRTLLEPHKNEIIAIANMLIEKQTIGQSEIDSIVKR